MSLLNDALREAEQRQVKPQTPHAYTGNRPSAGPRRSGKAVTLIGLLVVLLATAAGGLALLRGAPIEVLPEDASVASTESSRLVEPPQTAMPPMATERAEERAAIASEPAAATELSEAPAVPPPPEAPNSVDATELKTANISDPEPEPESEPASETTSAASPVKQVRETPEAVDLRSSRALARMLASGQGADAVRLLDSLTERQAAPNSREVVARDLLVQGHAERALNWLPAAIAADYSNLRLLRARALLELGRLNEAVATLAARVPAVADHLEYRVTLATLLQQAGESESSASHWAELIAYDDSRPAWWLGLAIALESGGRGRSAVRAYTQAASLPGLSSALADYARERLNALQAGS